MVAKRAALSPSGEKLPAGWTVRFRVLKTGRRTKYYENSRNGQKFFFKDDITRYADMLDGRKPTKSPIRRLSEDDKIHDNGNATNEVPEWLPRGWVMYVKTINSGPNRGKRYKSYQDQSTRHKFYSKLGVLRYLKAVKKKSGASEQKMKPTTVHHTTKVVSETSPEEDLPLGWTKKVRIRKSSGQRKSDSYYTDPETGYVFCSKRSVQHYLETGEISKRAFLPKERCINDNVPASDKSKQLIDRTNKQKLYADKHIDAGRVKSNARRSTTPSAANASRKETGKKMSPETKQFMVSTAENFPEKCTQDNAVNHGAESKESFEDDTLESEKGKSINRTSKNLCSSDHEEQLTLPRRSSRLAGLEPEEVANLLSGTLAIQNVLVTEGAQSNEILLEQTVGHEKENSNKRKSQRSSCNSDNKKGINLPCRFSKRLAGLEPEQKANSIAKPVAIQHIKKFPEGRVVLALLSNSLLKQTVVQQCHQILLEQTVEREKEKSNGRKSQRSLCNSDKKKELNLPCRFSKRLARLEPEQKANSITKPAAIQHIKKSPGGGVVLAVPSTSNCLGKEWRKVDVKIDKSEHGLNDASGRLLPNSSIKGHVKLYDKPVLRGATTLEIVGGSALGSAPATDTINGEILTVNIEKDGDDATVINSSGSRHLKELDLSQQSSEIPLGPTPKAKPYQSRSKTLTSKASKRNHSKKVGSQNTSLVTLGADVIHNLDFLESARTRQGKRKIQTSSSKFNLVNRLSLRCRSSKRIAGLEPEPVGNSNACIQVPQGGTTSKSGAQESHRPKFESQIGPPNCEYTDGNKASHVAILNNIQKSLPDQGISTEQHEEVKTDKIRNENAKSLLIAPSTEFWSDPCIEFAVKTLTGAIPIENFLNIELVSTAADSGNEKNPHKNQYQKSRMKEPVVRSSKLKRTIVLALESSKQDFGSVGRGKPTNPESKPSQKFKGGFMEYANRVIGFAKTASSYGSSSKRKEPTAQQPEKSEIENMKIKEATPPSFLSFGDCWSDPCVKYALETPAGPIPLMGDLSMLGNLQQQVDASQRDKEEYFQLQDTSLNQRDGSLVSPEFCFQNDISSYFDAPERKPKAKQLVPVHNPSLMPSANPSTAAGNSMNSQASHSKCKGGRKRRRS